MKRSHKIQAWLADRLSRVPDPNILPADATTRTVSKNPPLIKPVQPKSLWKKIPLLLKLLVILLLAIPVSLFFLFVAYLVLTAVLPYQA